ncbi:MAG: uracil-DNA glycosylase [Candidatus Marinimicrobia bacterium]|nr:uracil-DNA glycosylase [Candidatus Neomarinimicrobiota bacterium]
MKKEEIERAALLAAPPQECGLCKRLVQFRVDNIRKFPEWHNGAVSAFGPASANLLIVGLAPGLKGANRTGRPFTGDYAGDLLYPSLLKFGLAKGVYGAAANDGLVLTGCRITNAVRCVPPANKPTTEEQKTCRNFLEAEIKTMSRLKSILALGRIAHDAILSTLGARKSTYPFKHNAVHCLENSISVIDSYHCSRYNINTKVLTEPMFHEALKTAINTTNR